MPLDNWQPASAPPDTARLVIVTDGQKVLTGFYCTVKNHGWHVAYGIVPTDWMELPKPPLRE